MWTIIVSLAVGVIIGLLGIIPKKFMKYNSRFQQAGVILLLFSMGASIGSNRKLLSDLKSLGFKSITFAVMTCLCSIVITYIVSRKFIKEERN